MPPRDSFSRAPLVKKAFDQSQNPSPPAPKLISQAELQRLEKQRKTPTQQNVLQMRGPMGTAVRSQPNPQLETKIAEIKKARAQQQDRARDAFNQSRAKS